MGTARTRQSSLHHTFQLLPLNTCLLYYAAAPPSTTTHLPSLPHITTTAQHVRQVYPRGRRQGCPELPPHPRPCHQAYTPPSPGHAQPTRQARIHPLRGG